MLSENRGFTLMELLVSLVIISVIITIMFSAMRLGIRAWEKGEKDSDIMDRIHVISRQIRSQVASACLEEILDMDTGNKAVPFGFRGGQDSIEFLSRYPMSFESRSDLVYVRYLIEPSDSGGKDLFLVEAPVLFSTMEQFDGLRESFSDVKKRLLVKDVQDFEVRFLPTSTKESAGWQDHWGDDEATTTSFPKAMQLTFSVKGIPVEITARVMSEPSEK